MPKLNQRYYPADAREWIVILCNALQPYYVPSDPLLRFTPELDHELGRWRMADARCTYLTDVEAIAERDRIAIISARSSKWALAEKMNTIEG
jgi:hypothetical protein